MRSHFSLSIFIAIISLHGCKSATSNLSIEEESPKKLAITKSKKNKIFILNQEDNDKNDFKALAEELQKKLNKHSEKGKQEYEIEIIHSTKEINEKSSPDEDIIVIGKNEEMSSSFGLSGILNKDKAGHQATDNKNSEPNKEEKADTKLVKKDKLTKNKPEDKGKNSTDEVIIGSIAASAAILGIMAGFAIKKKFSKKTKTRLEHSDKKTVRLEQKQSNNKVNTLNKLANIKNLIEDIVFKVFHIKGKSLSLVKIKKLTPQRIDEIKADKSDNIRNTFDNLLWTHNMPSNTFLKIMETNNSFSIKPSHRGAQFRYGLDSQYGDITFILKPRAELDFKTGVTPEGLQTESVQYVNLWKKNATTFNLRDNSEEINKLLKEQAEEYGFRRNLKAEEHQKGGFAGCTLKPRPSWCNLQIHIGENVPPKSIAAVMIPEFLLGDPNILNNIRTKMPGVEIIPVKGIDQKNYYSYFNKNETGQLVDERGNNSETLATARDRAIKLNMMRDYKRGEGNSSRVSLSPEAFEEAQAEYMKFLLKTHNKYNPKETQIEQKQEVPLFSV